MSYSSINRVVLVGRLTRDPELRELPSGRSLCNLRLACNGVRRDPEGEYRERPHYFDVVAFAGLAENVARYMHKGSLVAIDGRLDWREWEIGAGSESDGSKIDRSEIDGSKIGQQKRQAVSVVAENVQFLERPAGEPREGGGEGVALDGTAPEGELVGVGAGEVDLVF
ncbi:MAG TPA: single-stranded DNA-binding protein [Solirubrobacteraceae bacterium]|jgi:single-strand DNA-binding protein|nr:single-stranded DNA-binding protein [Solirubrobacteraceae bacterium]